MERRFTIEELRKFCIDPFFCGICMKKTDKIECHVCRDCLKVSPRRLPVVSIEDGKSYFFDKKLQQLRNVKNPHDHIDIL